MAEQTPVEVGAVVTSETVINATAGPKADCDVCSRTRFGWCTSSLLSVF